MQVRSPRQRGGALGGAIEAIKLPIMLHIVLDNGTQQGLPPTHVSWSRGGNARNHSQHQQINTLTHTFCSSVRLCCWFVFMRHHQSLFAKNTVSVGCWVDSMDRTSTTIQSQNTANLLPCGRSHHHPRHVISVTSLQTSGTGTVSGGGGSISSSALCKQSTHNFVACNFVRVWSGAAAAAQFMLLN